MMEIMLTCHSPRGWSWETCVKIYWESKWASEASGMARFSKVIEVTDNNLYCLIEGEQD